MLQMLEMKLFFPKAVCLRRFTTPLCKDIIHNTVHNIIELLCSNLICCYYPSTQKLLYPYCLQKTCLYKACVHCCSFLSFLPPHIELVGGSFVQLCSPHMVIDDIFLPANTWKLCFLKTAMCCHICK